MMDTAKAQGIVVTTGLGVAALVVFDAARLGHRPEPRRLLGTLATTFALSIGATVAPGVAGPLALLWGLSTVIVSGGPVFVSLGYATAKPKPPTTRT